MTSPSGIEKNKSHTLFVAIDVGRLSRSILITTFLVYYYIVGKFTKLQE